MAWTRRQSQNCGAGGGGVSAFGPGGVDVEDILNVETIQVGSSAASTAALAMGEGDLRNSAVSMWPCHLPRNIFEPPQRLCGCSSTPKRWPISR